jgi:hypothetical protein
MSRSTNDSLENSSIRKELVSEKGENLIKKVKLTKSTSCKNIYLEKHGKICD